MLLKSIDQIGFKATLIAFILLFTACSKKEEITFYDKSLKTNRLNCLAYEPIKNGKLEQELKSLYKFDNSCKYRLTLSYKSNIVCNSSYNAYEKSTSNFPNAYINLEVKKGFNLEYSYYIDLTHKPTILDIKEGFKRLKNDILK